MVQARQYKLSASSIAAFKACPTRFRLSYREGLRPDQDTESQRVGTNWHGIHEVYQNTEGDHDIKLSAVVEHLNERYDKVPSWTNRHTWDLEKQILLTCFVAYCWYYSDDTIEYVQQEIPFKLGLQIPKIGMDLPIEEVVRVGKIDHLINWGGMVGTFERKSTTRDIDPSSSYWERSKKDTQVSMYSLAIRDLHDQGVLPLDGIEYERLGNTLYDVWRRPSIKPKALTQKDTLVVLETGEYYGQKFDVVQEGEALIDGKIRIPEKVFVNGEESEITVMKKGIAIRETIEMFAARLLDDITERPAHYFQRKEIARTKKELDKFRIELYNIYTAQKTFEKTGCWFENESQCRATFTCQYVPICYGPGADAVCDGKTTPDGFKRIFVDLTVEGQQSSEGEE